MSELYKRIISSLILIPLTIFLTIEGDIFFYLFLTLCFFICIYEWKKMVNKIEHKIFGFVFLIFSFFSVFMMRSYDPCCIDFDIGLRLFLTTLIICVSSDIGGYIFGKLLKGPTITSISPNKTYSGMIGSIYYP